MYVCVFYFTAIGSGGWLSIVILSKEWNPRKKNRIHDVSVGQNVYDSITPDKYVCPHRPPMIKWLNFGYSGRKSMF